MKCLNEIDTQLFLHDCFSPCTAMTHYQDIQFTPTSSPPAAAAPLLIWLHVCCWRNIEPLRQRYTYYAPLRGSLEAWWSIFTWSCVTAMCKGTSEYTLQIIDPPYCFVAHSVWSLVHAALPALPQCNLHFPHVHYQAAAVCFAFIPQVAPHMKITHHIPWENSLSLNSALLTISCTLTSWLPLCFVWNHSTLGAKSRKSQLPHKWPASLLRWSSLCSSPVLFNS